MEQIIQNLETNPWFLAGMVILSNVGMKYIEEDLDQKKCDILNCQISRKLIIFALIFCSTKSLKVSIISTLLYSLIVKFT